MSHATDTKIRIIPRSPKKLSLSDIQIPDIIYGSLVPRKILEPSNAQKTTRASGSKTSHQRASPTKNGSPSSEKIFIKTLPKHIGLIINKGKVIFDELLSEIELSDVILEYGRIPLETYVKHKSEIKKGSSPTQMTHGKMDGLIMETYINDGIKYCITKEIKELTVRHDNIADKCRYLVDKYFHTESMKAGSQSNCVRPYIVHLIINIVKMSSLFEPSYLNEIGNFFEMKFEMRRPLINEILWISFSDFGIEPLFLRNPSNSTMFRNNFIDALSILINKYKFDPTKKSTYEDENARQSLNFASNPIPEDWKMEITKLFDEYEKKMISNISDKNLRSLFNRKFVKMARDIRFSPSDMDDSIVTTKNIGCYFYRKHPQIFVDNFIEIIGNITNEYENEFGLEEMLLVLDGPQNVGKYPENLYDSSFDDIEWNKEYVKDEFITELCSRLTNYNYSENLYKKIKISKYGVILGEIANYKRIHNDEFIVKMFNDLTTLPLIIYLNKTKKLVPSRISQFTSIDHINFCLKFYDLDKFIIEKRDIINSGIKISFFEMENELKKFYGKHIKKYIELFNIIEGETLIKNVNTELSRYLTMLVNDD